MRQEEVRKINQKKTNKITNVLEWFWNIEQNFANEHVDEETMDATSTCVSYFRTLSIVYLKSYFLSL